MTLDELLAAGHVVSVCGGGVISTSDEAKISVISTENVNVWSILWQPVCAPLLNQSSNSALI